MSGDYSLDTVEYETPEVIKKVMSEFGVDEKIAEKIVAFCNAFALEKMKKWIFNYRKRQKDKAEELYKLTRKLKKLVLTEWTGDAHPSEVRAVVDEIEKRILELCVSNE